MKTIAIIAAAIIATLLGSSPATAGQDHHHRKGRFTHVTGINDYLVVGDSITVGIGTSNPPVTGYAPLSGVPYHGVGGSCIVGCAPSPEIRVWLPAYVDGLASKPATIVAMIGTNDYPNRESGEIIAAMQDLRATMATRDIRMVFGTITPAPAGSYWNIGATGHAKATRLAVNSWLRSHTDYLGPEYAKALSTPGNDLKPAYVGPMGDVHVGDAGAEKMETTLLAWIANDQ